jgi:signal peptidase I
LEQTREETLMDIGSERWEAELGRLKYRRRFLQTMYSTIGMLITVSAAAILVAVLLLPVLRIYGTSMTPTLTEGDYVVSVKGSDYETGDICCFYYNNKILVKRVIAKSGDWVDIDEDGTVYVNHEKIDEPYVTDLALGECDIELPYQVPEKRLFVLGDHRSVSVDSRSTTIGCVAEEQMVGKVIFRVWPLGSSFGKIR